MEWFKDQDLKSWSKIKGWWGLSRLVYFDYPFDFGSATFRRQVVLKSTISIMHRLFTPDIQMA